MVCRVDSYFFMRCRLIVEAVAPTFFGRPFDPGSAVGRRQCRTCQTLLWNSVRSISHDGIEVKMEIPL